MQPLFRVYLNGVYINDEPRGIIDTELSLKRDEDLKGVFLQYTSEITFHGDGYAELLPFRDTCSNVSCNIEYKCAETHGYELLYEATIPIGSEEIEWDDYNCTVTCRLENADFSNLITRMGDNVIPVNNPTTVNNNEALAAVTENLTEFFSSFAGVFASAPIGTYLFTDLLQQALSYISNNQITLVPDPLYSTLYLAQVLRLNFIDPLAPGDTIEIEFTNYYGQQYSITYVCTGVSDVGAFAVQLLHVGDPGVAPEISRTNYLEKASRVQVSGSIIDVFNFLPWDPVAISVNAGGKLVTLTETQAFQYGLKNLGVTSSTFLQEQKATLTYTLNDLLTHATEMHNMGFRLAKTSTGYDFHLTFLPDMLVNADSNVNIPQSPQLRTKASKEYSVNSLTTAKGNADNVFKPFTWNAANCFGDNKKLEGQRFSSQEFFDLFTATQVQDDELYFVFLREGDYTEAEGFRLIASNSTTVDDQFHYNIPYMMALIAKQSQIYAANNDFYANIPLSANDPYSTCTNCPDAVLPNTNPIVLKNVTTFDYPLTFSQVRNLIDNPLQYITFSDGRRVSKRGFIKEVKIPFNNFTASFELYTD
jgi:hypothetical protein